MAVIDINVEKIEKRKILRKENLLSLYNFYFENRGRPSIVTFEDNDEGIESKLAYVYLSDLGLIRASPARQGALEVIISAHGISVVESENDIE